VAWAAFLPILFFLGISVLELGPMNVKDRQTSDRLPGLVGYQSRVTLATSVPILVFLGLSVLDLGPSILYLAQRLRDSLGCK